jgi:hypothetical protein
MAQAPAYAGEGENYRSYLLRLWREDGGQPPWRQPWRASLESAVTGDCRGFASLDALFRFLRQQTGASSNSDQEGSANNEG